MVLSLHLRVVGISKELTQQGFNEKELTINCTNKVQNYGYPIFLNVNYIYTLELPLLGEKEIEMTINRESVSKR